MTKLQLLRQFCCPSRSPQETLFAKAHPNLRQVLECAVERRFAVNHSSRYTVAFGTWRSESGPENSLGTALHKLARRR